MKQFEQIQSTEELIAKGKDFAEQAYSQLAETALKVALQRNGADSDIDCKGGDYLQLKKISQITG